MKDFSFKDIDYLISPSALAVLSNYSNQVGETTSSVDIVSNFLEEIKSIDYQEKEKDMFDFNDMFNGMFKQVKPGYCKISMNGQPAIKTANGYKVYDFKKNRLVNCANFAFDMDGMFWVVPTFKVEVGDIILVNNKPRCVIEVHSNSIKTFSYDESTIDEVVPEHHVFMGRTYCYGKLFSPFMNMTKNDSGMQNMMTMMMMSQMFNNDNHGYNNNMNGINPMMFMMMGNNNIFEGMFDGAFNFGNEITTPIDNDEDEEV